MYDSDTLTDALEYLEWLLVQAIRDTTNGESPECRDALHVATTVIAQAACVPVLGMIDIIDVVASPDRLTHAERMATVVTT